MKLCVLMVGVARPSSERIIENIIKNCVFLKENYPSHSFHFVVCFYRNEQSTDILDYCAKNNITTYCLEPILQSDIPADISKYMFTNSPDIETKNRYRMFYSMDYILKKIPTDYDCVVRIRLDTELNSFELNNTIKENTYYTVLDTNTSCSDNIGYGSYKVMKNVWALKNCFLKSINPETLVFNSIKKNAYKIEQFKFEYKMYQSDAEYCDGIKQWSRSNRIWSFNGKDYIRGIRVGV